MSKLLQSSPYYAQAETLWNRADLHCVSFSANGGYSAVFKNGDKVDIPEAVYRIILLGEVD